MLYQASSRAKKKNCVINPLLEQKKNTLLSLIKSKNREESVYHASSRAKEKTYFTKPPLDRTNKMLYQASSKAKNKCSTRPPLKQKRRIALPGLLYTPHVKSRSESKNGNCHLSAISHDFFLLNK